MSRSLVALGTERAALELLKSLIAIPSAHTDSTTIHERIASEFADLGCRVRLVSVDHRRLTSDPEFSPPLDPPEGGVVNVVGEWGRQPPSLLLFAHLDTEPASVHPGWTGDPLEPTLRDGRVYGLGAADDKAGLAAMIGAVRALRELGLEEEVGLSLAAVCAKQGGSLGTLPVIRSLSGVRAAIYCHPPETGAGIAQLKVGSRGILTAELIVTGLTPHPAEIGTPASIDPNAGVNAIEIMAALVRRLVQRSEGLHDVAVSVNRIDGGIEAPTVADRCTAEVTVWFADRTVGDVEAWLRRVIGEYGDPWLHSHPAEVRLRGLRANPAATRSDDRLVSVLATEIAEVHGTDASLYAGHVASDIRFPMRCLDAPSVGFGPLAGNFYGPDEWVDVASFLEAIEVLVRSVIAYQEAQTPDPATSHTVHSAKGQAHD